ncbi:MAG: hypothetical protein ACLFTR_00670 [Candidatus Woesearchaeota archaeon]
MRYVEENRTIEEVFYRQVRELSSRAAMKTLEDFNRQFSGRCFL